MKYKHYKKFGFALLLEARFELQIGGDRALYLNNYLSPLQHQPLT